MSFIVAGGVLCWHCLQESSSMASASGDGKRVDATSRLSMHGDRGEYWAGTTFGSSKKLTYWFKSDK